MQFAQRFERFKTKGEDAPDWTLAAVVDVLIKSKSIEPNGH